MVPPEMCCSHLAWSSVTLRSRSRGFHHRATEPQRARRRRFGGPACERRPMATDEGNANTRTGHDFEARVLRCLRPSSAASRRPPNSEARFSNAVSPSWNPALRASRALRLTPGSVTPCLCASVANLAFDDQQAPDPGDPASRHATGNAAQCQRPSDSAPSRPTRPRARHT